MLTPAELVWLIAAVAKGDEAAFERLYAATRAKLFGVVLRILRRQDLAEEVIQEAYVKIWNSAGQFNPGLSSPITWMASIARNRAIDIVRKRTEASIEEEPAAMEVAADTPDPLARREMTEELKRLLECVGRLEPDRQKLVLLAYYNGWSREQLAAKFATPVNTVKTWLRRSMMDIRECLGLEMMAYSEDHIVLAAEYALGTLDADERAQVETMMSVDKGFTAMVQAWEQKLGVLNQMVGSIEPRPEVWDKIRTAAGLSAPQEPLVLPQAAPPPPVAPEISQPAAAVDNSNVIALSAKVRRWRNIATLATAVAAALVAMIGVQAYRPDLLPEGIRPKPRTQVVEVRIPAAPVPAAQYVAILQKEGGSPAFILTVDGATKNFTVRKVGAAAEPGKSFELWLISDKLQRPRSLGVIGSADFTARPVLSAYDADTINAATYAVTVEQAGGSPDGKPTSAPVYAGKLIETVPPPAAAPSPAH